MCMYWLYVNYSPEMFKIVTVLLKMYKSQNSCLWHSHAISIIVKLIKEIIFF